LLIHEIFVDYVVSVDYFSKFVTISNLTRNYTLVGLLSMSVLWIQDSVRALSTTIIYIN